MTRDAYTDRLLELAYGELPKREAREVERHAASCGACRAELERIRGTRRTMAALPDEPAPEGGERVLLAAAREAAGGRPRRLAPRWLVGGAVAAASLAVVAAVSYRVVELAPRRDERTALLGPSPYASPPPPQDVSARAGAEPGRAARPEAPPEAKRAPSRAGAAPRDEAPAARSDEGSHALAPPPFAAPTTAPAPAPAPPSPAAEARERAAPATRKSASPAGAAAADLSAAAPPRTEVRTFPGCEGEAVRRVELDARGRTVRYVREGTVGGRRVRVEQTFGPDGRPARVAMVDLDAPGQPLDAGALGISLPATAAEAGIDAPPRCGP